MQHALLLYLRCPISKTSLRFQLISVFTKQYDTGPVQEICEGILFSDMGFVFPIIDGIPRMNLESIYEYSDFLMLHIPYYKETRAKLEAAHKELITYCAAKNKRTKESFEFEWGFLRSDKEDKIWHEDLSALSDVLTAEVGESVSYFENKRIIDVGCGHGIMTSRIGEVSGMAIGVELSKSIEKAYSRNMCYRAHYLQADLQFLPFANSTFDLVYSSGVIHHTNNTHLSFLLIDSMVKNGGKICLWLYHPRISFVHSFFLMLRKITTKIPRNISFLLLCIFVFPISYVVKRLGGKGSPNLREEMIDMLDFFTPEFRSEIPHDIAKTWLIRENYTDIKITSENTFGFSITGKKLIVPCLCLPGVLS